ncbi:MAG: hypothetical protein IPL46_01665 [Saprospiraceae bacterium]|nr:hypothetical protein [Saprospiraceae bacterium]
MSRLRISRYAGQGVTPFKPEDSEVLTSTKEIVRRRLNRIVDHTNAAQKNQYGKSGNGFQEEENL